jgi:hypothetical protein
MRVADEEREYFGRHFELGGGGGGRAVGPNFKFGLA